VRKSGKNQRQLSLDSASRDGGVNGHKKARNRLGMAKTACSLNRNNWGSLLLPLRTHHWSEVTPYNSDPRLLWENTCTKMHWRPVRQLRFRSGSGQWLAMHSYPHDWVEGKYSKRVSKGQMEIKMGFWLVIICQRRIALWIDFQSRIRNPSLNLSWSKKILQNRGFGWKSSEAGLSQSIC